MIVSYFGVDYASVRLTQVHAPPPPLTPGGSIVKLKKIAQFLWLRGSVRSLEMAFRGVNASLTEIV